jgi:hypothetical protein
LPARRAPLRRAPRALRARCRHRLDPRGVGRHRPRGAGVRGENPGRDLRGGELPRQRRPPARRDAARQGQGGDRRRAHGRGFLADERPGAGPDQFRLFRRLGCRARRVQEFNPGRRR